MTPPEEDRMDVAREIEKLQTMSVGQLQKRWNEVYGEPARSRNRIFLWRRIAWRIQELEFGGLSERAKRRAEELARDADLRMRVPKGAFAAGEAAQGPGGGAGGGLGVAGVPAVARGLPGAGPGRTIARPLASAAARRLPQAGTILVRDYQGRRLCVKVLEKGFEFDGRIFRSLSAVAREITGTNWNGPVFFGLSAEGGNR